VRRNNVKVGKVKHKNCKITVNGLQTLNENHFQNTIKNNKQWQKNLSRGINPILTLVLSVTWIMVKQHLTAAITDVLSKKGLAEKKNYDDIDGAPEEKKGVLQLIQLTLSMQTENVTMLTLTVRVTLIM
jgi:hypothetical protein